MWEHVWSGHFPTSCGKQSDSILKKLFTVHVWKWLKPQCNLVCVSVWPCEWAGIVPGWWGLRGGCRCEERFYWASDSESQTWKIKTQNWLKSSKTGGELKDTWHHQYASFTMNKTSSLCSFILKITHTLISAFFKSKNNKSVSSFSHVKVCSFSFIPSTSFRFELLK